MQNVGEQSAILWTFIKLPFVIKIFDLSSFKWPIKKGFTAVESVPLSHEIMVYHQNKDKFEQ